MISSRVENALERSVGVDRVDDGADDDEGRESESDEVGEAVGTVEILRKTEKRLSLNPCEFSSSQPTLADDAKKPRSSFSDPFSGETPLITASAHFRGGLRRRGRLEGLGARYAGALGRVYDRLLGEELSCIFLDGVGVCGASGLKLIQEGDDGGVDAMARTASRERQLDSPTHCRQSTYESEDCSEWQRRPEQTGGR